MEKNIIFLDFIFIYKLFKSSRKDLKSLSLKWFYMKIYNFLTSTFFYNGSWEKNLKKGTFETKEEKHGKGEKGQTVISKIVLSRKYF